VHNPNKSRGQWAGEKGEKDGVAGKPTLSREKYSGEKTHLYKKGKLAPKPTERKGRRKKKKSNGFVVGIRRKNSLRERKKKQTGRKSKRTFKRRWRERG